MCIPMMLKNPILEKTFFGLACVAMGVLCAFSMPDKSIWPLMFAGLSGLYVLYSKTKTAAQAFLCGFLFALGYFVTGLWWIGNALLVDGNDFAWVWPISVIGLPTLLGLFTGTYLAIARMVKTPTTFGGFIIFALFLTFSEWARGNAFTGFPWNLYGYVWIDYLPMAQSAYYFGAYGLTFITILWAALGGFLFVSQARKNHKIIIAAVGIFSMAVVFSVGNFRLENNPTTFDAKNIVVVVQPNIPQSMKWDPVAIQDNFEKMVNLSKHSQTIGRVENVFVVWPETAISPIVYTNHKNMDLIREVLQSYDAPDAYLVTGILRRMQTEDGTTNYANSVAFMNDELSALHVYNKTHLVPFGEFIPFQDFIPIKPVAAFKGFERGDGAMLMTRGNVPAFSPLICYEIIFPGQIVPSTQDRPKWIVNVTNDGWYGDSAGPHQHFAQTRLRAIEEGIPVIRSANTGISGVIDSYGRVVELKKINDTGVITSHIPDSIITPPPATGKSVPYIFLICVLVIMFRKLFFLKSIY